VRRRGLLSKRWLGRQLVAKGFDEREVARVLPACVATLRSYGFSTEGSAKQFLDDERVDRELRILYREKLGRTTAPLDVSGYIEWGPRLYMTNLTPISRGALASLLQNSSESRDKQKRASRPRRRNPRRSK